LTRTIDFPTLLLALAVIALFGIFFWHVARVFWGSARHVTNVLEAWSQRDRRRPAYEPRHKPPLTWKQILRRAIQGFLILAMVGLLWLKLRGL